LHVWMCFLQEGDDVDDYVYFVETPKGEKS
jgi:hypothetical protein